MFRMILPESLPSLIAAEAQDAAETRAIDADAAAAGTRSDYGRVSRWALGLLGTAGATVAVAVLGFAVAVPTSGKDPLGDAVFASIVLLVAVALATPSVWLLIGLHRSGRRLARAAAFWAARPYLQGARTRTDGDWFAVRFAVYSPDLLLRLITSTLSALAMVFAASAVVRELAITGPVWAIVMWSGWVVLFGAVCAGQFGGVQRIQNGYLPREPAR